MCGIAGIINPGEYDLNQMKQALFHRGPDAQSIFVEDNVALIHTRLAIQDIQHGIQPFHYQDYSIIFNGEIYNHLALRPHLAEFSFKTRSDTETLLYLYIKYGNAMFDLLDGMFAFCIYDRQNRRLVLARDRAGKKPLYYLQTTDSFIFASELNALKTIQPLAINEAAIHCYLRAGFIYKTHTPYKKVAELAPATYALINLDNRNIETHCYYDILSAYTQPTTTVPHATALAQVEEKLQISINDRLLSSDVPVGVFLSGGIDSNLVVAMAARTQPNLRTFTVKFSGCYDESPLAKLTAEQYQTKHTEISIEMDVKKDIETILTRYGEPFMDSSAIPSYYVAHAARKEVGVVLNGDGADELFGGYRRYVATTNKMLSYLKYFAPLKAALPKPHQKQSAYNYFYRLLSMAGKQGLDYYLSATSDIYEDIWAFQANPILEEMHDFVAATLSNPQLSPLSKLLYLDFNLLLFSDLLVKMDIATMANSLEARSPFLSKHMLALAPSLPDHYKINKIQTKFILRELAKKYLPPTLVHQPKRGFEVPLKNWVEVDLREQIYDSLSLGCYAESYVDRALINQLLNAPHAFPAEKRAKILWGLFCLEVWYKNEKTFLIGRNYESYGKRVGVCESSL